jgi:DNA modification methylase
MKPDYQGDNWAVYLADCIEVMNGMPDGIIDLAIFSPPFSDLFVYSDSERDMGNCGSHEEFMEHYAYFTEALYRVLKPGRIACVHCSDLPARKSKDGFIGLHDFGGDLIRSHQEAGWVYHARCTIWKDPVIEMQRTKALGPLYKQLKKDSTRSRVGMPDYMLFFRKNEDNPEPVTHCPEDLPVGMWQELASPVWMRVNQTKVLNGRMAKGQEDERHICPLQLDVIDRCLTLYSNPGDLVLDPFNGIGSTGYQAIKMGRRYIGCELKPEYAKQAAKFLQGAEQQSGSLLELLGDGVAEPA